MHMMKKMILLVDDDTDFLWLTTRMLEESGYSVVQARDGKEALKQFEETDPDLLLLDFRLPGELDGLKVAEKMRKTAPSKPILIITGYAEIKIAVKAMKMGIYDYVTKPINPDDFLFAIKRALEKQELEHKVAQLEMVLNDRPSLFETMGQSEAIKRLFEHVEKVAPTRFTVLIEGESGTGKELVAGAIHDMSQLKDGPFVAVDCGAIPENLIESELFGYQKGAFTGAYNNKAGHFEMAKNGTLFLDEVGNLSYTVQQKLLRAIQERKIQRLGGGDTISVSARIIAATNQSLEADVNSGSFRSDLYFRLNEFTIRLPSLRERVEDIAYLAKRFQTEVEKELGKKCNGISQNAMKALTSYSWPGNVRELRNTIRQSVLLCEEKMTIKPEHLTFVNHPSGRSQKRNSVGFSADYDRTRSFHENVGQIRDTVEKKVILSVLQHTGGNKSRASRTLQIDYKTLLRKIKKHNIGDSSLKG